MNAVEKALHILLAFRPERPSWGVRELSGHLGFSPATVQRILNTLRADGFVDQDPETRQYRLGSIFYRFLGTLQGAYPFVRAALPVMKRVLDRTRETVHLNVIQGRERVCIDTLDSPQSLKGSMPVGSTSPLYAGASSKCLLAFSDPEFVDAYLRRTRLKPVTGATIVEEDRLRAELRSIRKQGYAQSLGERTPGLGSLSAPIQNHRGMLLGAISLAIPEIRFEEAKHRRFCLKELVGAADAISKTMGRAP